MTTKTISLTGRGILTGLVGVLLLALAGLATAATPATSTLDNVQYQTLPGNRVELTLTFAGSSVPQPTIFTTANPPTIAVDFMHTVNATGKRHVKIGEGATNGITLVSAGGRTRMVVGLLRTSNYQSTIHGNRLQLLISNGQQATAGTLASTIDPTKQLPTPAGSAVVSKIGFRRGANGQARVLVDYQGTGLQSQVVQENGKVAVHVSGATVPARLARRLDVTDFATPVDTIDTTIGHTGGATLMLTVNGDVTASSYNNGHQLVVEVARQAKKKKTNVIGAENKEHYTGKPATFDFQNIPVRAALQLIAEQSHLNIVASDSVKGSVTLRLVDVPWDQALDVILRAKGLAKRRDGNVVWIAPQTQIAQYEQREADARQKAENSAHLVAAYIPISYGKAADIAKLLSTETRTNSGSGSSNSGENNQGFLGPRGSVSFDIRTNTLLINDTPKKVAELRKLVAVLDQPVQQVLIEARIVAATNTFTRNLGVKWGAQVRHTSKGGNVTYGFGGDSNSAQGALSSTTGLSIGGGTGSGGSGGTGSGSTGFNVNLPIGTPVGSAAIAILGANYLVDLELQAAQTEGQTEIISSPRVITANQQPADIQQGQQIGYVTFQQGTAGSLGTATVQFKNAVLELKVTPTITADKRVFLKINVRKDALAKFIDNPGGGQVPLLNTQSLTTSVLVDNGQTVVLGGIYEINKNNNITKVPGLGDIPILGALFRSKSKSNTKGELLIFVTPRILSETGT